MALRILGIFIICFWSCACSITSDPMKSVQYGVRALVFLALWNWVKDRR